MPTTAWKFAGTASGWTNSGNVSAQDDAMATVSLSAGQYTGYLIAKNFGFTTADVPSGSTINGLEFRIRWKRTYGYSFATTMASVRFSWGGSDGNKAASFPAITNSFNQFVIGGVADTWGVTTLSDPGGDAEVRHSEFGLITRGYNADGKYSFEGGIDSIEMRVTYTAPATTTTTTTTTTSTTTTTTSTTTTTTSTTTTTTTTSTTTTTTTATPSTTTTPWSQGETRFGLYSYKPGFGSINPRNSHFKRGSQS